MKKYLLIAVLVLSLILSATACGRENTENETTTLPMNNLQTEATENMSESSDSTDVSEKVLDDIGGGYITSDKYRQRFYDVAYNFTLLVDREEYLEWKAEMAECREELKETMRMVKFIKHFNISKEDFEKANLELAKEIVEMGEKPTMRSSDFENQQVYEIYNADIIYTFDNEIINEYYLTPEYKYCSEDEYEYFVEKGEYQSLVTVWVDVDQMESEFIEKYGYSPFDIVTETTEELTEQATEEESTIVTDEVITE